MDEASTGITCPDCGANITSPRALSCPNCHCLIHAADLEDLTRKAQIASNGGNLALARRYWAQSAELLPVETIQYKSIQARIADLDHKIAAGPTSGKSTWKRGAAGLGPVAVLLWKFKVILLGLTKLGTLVSMFASLGLYWSLYGWAFALGLVVSIYIHEMGHVIALRKFGIPAGAPVFIPGFGAIIQLRGVRLPPLQDSRIGLAGPIYGLGTALFSLAMFFATGSKMWAAIANLGAVINLFNLIPIWQLDGARGFHSLTRTQRAILLGLSTVLWLISSTGMLFLIVLGAAYRLFKKDSNEQPDNIGFMQFAGLLAALTAVIALTPVR
jgi:Zn-dependent protease